MYAFLEPTTCNVSFLPHETEEETDSGKYVALCVREIWSVRQGIRRHDKLQEIIQYNTHSITMCHCQWTLRSQWI